MQTVFTTQPQNFKSKLDVVGILIIHEQQILFLLRNADVLEGNKWGFVAGKVKEGESFEEALNREVAEETGISDLQAEFQKSLFIRNPKLEYMLHMYIAQFSEKPKIDIAHDVNQDYRWMTFEDFMKCETVLGNIEVIQEIDAVQ